MRLRSHHVNAYVFPGTRFRTVVDILMGVGSDPCRLMRYWNNGSPLTSGAAEPAQPDAPDAPDAIFSTPPAFGMVLVPVSVHPGKGSSAFICKWPPSFAGPCEKSPFSIATGFRVILTLARKADPSKGSTPSRLFVLNVIVASVPAARKLHFLSAQSEGILSNSQIASSPMKTPTSRSW